MRPTPKYEYKNLECCNCGGIFDSKTRNKVAKYCSVECFKVKAKEIPNIGCFKKGHKGSKNWYSVMTNRVGEKHHNFGKKLSEEVKKKISNSRKGKASGANCYLWKGGITQINRVIRTSTEGKKWRENVFKRDIYKCVDCGDDKGGNLNADHIRPLSVIIKQNKIKTFQEALNCKELWDINNGRTLCSICHNKSHMLAIGDRSFKKLTLIPNL